MQREPHHVCMPAVAATGLKARKVRTVLQLVLLLVLLLPTCTPAVGPAAREHRSRALHTWSDKLARRLRASAHSSASAQPSAAEHKQTTSNAGRGTSAANSSLLARASRQLRNLMQVSADPSPDVLPVQGLLNSSSSSLHSLDSTNLTTNSSSTSNGTSIGAVPKPAYNPWYEQHLPGSSGSWGSGLLYGMFNNSRAALDPGPSADATVATDTTQTVPDPPPYDYPPVGIHPTVFFTAVLPGFTSTNGLRPEQQLAFSAAINAFLAPSPNVVITNTTVITQGLAGSGLWLPCATAFFTADSGSLQDFLASTLQSDPNLILPTATWGSVRTTNIKAAQPAAPASISYNWVVGDYANCSVMCGGGVQQRQVACLDNYGNAADPSMCPQPPPQNSRPCQTQPCQASLPSAFTLALGPWGPCNATCSYGGRTRGATCVSKEGYIGSLSNCITSPEELAAQLWQACMLPPCPTFIWAYSDWVCDNSAGCGGGTASRNASCIIAATAEEVDASMCDFELLDNSTQPCAQGPCVLFYWRARELADCLPEDPLNPCGRYLQRRGFDCVNMTSGEVVTNLYCNGPKPVLGEVECTKPAAVDCSAGAPAPIAAPISTSTTPLTPTTGPDSSTAGPPVEASTTVDPGSGTAPVSSASSSGGASGSSSSSSSSSGDAGVGGPGVPQQGSTIPTEPPAATTSGGSSSAGSPTDSSSGSSSGGSSSNPPPASPGSSSPSPGSGASSPPSDGVPGEGPPPAASPPDTVGTSGGAGSGPDSSSGSDGSSGSSSSGFPMDIGTGGNSSGNGSGSSNNSTDGASGSSGGIDAGAGVGDSSSGGSSSSSGGTTTSSSSGSYDLGPGPNLPGWLLSNPTPALKNLLQCTGGYALSADGKCCSGALIDSKGSCCDVGTVDACGICNGTGIAIDSLGACCSGVLDAQGICCSGAVDECGVCNGTNACDLKADFVVSMLPAVLYLVPASNANRRLRAAIQDSVASVLSRATGRLFEKARVAVQLSAYIPQGAKAQQAADGTIIASEGVDEGIATTGNNTAAALTRDAVYANSGPTFIGPPVAALPHPVGGAAGGGSSMPVQMDQVMQAPQQLDAPTTRANLAAQLHASPVAERGSRSSTGKDQQQLPVTSQQLAASNSGLKSTGAAAAAAAAGAEQRVVRRVLHSLQLGRVLAQLADASIADGSLDSSNALEVSVTLKPPASGSGTDTGSAVMALNQLVGTQLAVPGSRNRLGYKQVTQVFRAGTCGDGVCQVNERLSWNNPDSCPADCAMPFLSCPPFNTTLPPCNGLGVCYNSIGSCACTTGYAGPDCSSCAVGYKRISGYCVAGVALMPDRLCAGGVCVDSLKDSAALAVVTPPRSLVPGQAAVAVVVLVSMALMAGAAVCVYRARYKALLFMHAQEVAERARMAAD